MSPADPSVVYAMPTRRTPKAASLARWRASRASVFVTGGNYYNEVFADPKNVDRVYAVDVMLQVPMTVAHFRRGENLKHVDNHSVWIDPDITDHLIVGCDGG
jgi:hypothetical protein